MIKDRIKKIAFANESIRKAYFALTKGKFEDKRLAGFINRAISDLRRDPFCGIRVPSKLWPKEYMRKYTVDNLWKYDLPDGWRLIYTVHGNEVEIISILIEWMDHKNYERRFGYD